MPAVGRLWPSDDDDDDNVDHDEQEMQNQVREKKQPVQYLVDHDDDEDSGDDDSGGGYDGFDHQVQELEEKNIKKDSLIKKLAETVVKSPGLSVHAVIDSLRL